MKRTHCVVVDPMLLGFYFSPPFLSQNIFFFFFTVKIYNIKQLQLNPGDSVMDIRQFLLDAPETCFFTCYDLLLHTKDGSVHQLEDYNEISEVADITTGSCTLEMVAGIF